MADRVPPQSIEAEQSLLGALMIDNSSLAEVASIIKARSFYKENHQHIFQAILDLFEKNEKSDLITVSEQLKSVNQLDAIGGRVYLADLTNSIVNTGGTVKYANIIKDKELLRNLITIGGEISELAISEEEAPLSILDASQKKLYDLSQGRMKSDFSPLEELITDFLDNMGKEDDPQIPTSFEDLDGLIGGFSKSDLVIIAASPSVGKTSFAMNVAMNIATRQNIPVGIFSIEMPKEQIAMRILSSEAEIEMNRLRKANVLQNYEYNKINKAFEKLGRAPIFVDDTSYMTTMDLQSKARKLKSEHGIGLFVVDFIQQMYATNLNNRRYENRTQEISEVIRTIKNTARETECPFIALSQLSRSIEQRHEKTPMLSDLRESGEIEQVADMVMFLHRDDYQNQDIETDTAQVIVAKNRNGATGKINLRFKKEYTRFYNATNEG
jgi:replicative DNA helicase